MRTLVFSGGLAVALLGGLTLPPSALAGDRAAEQIIKEIDAVKMPKPDMSKVKDEAYVKQFIADRTKAVNEKTALIGELNKVDPANPKLAKLLPERWMGLSSTEEDSSATVLAETKAVLAGTKDQMLKAEATYYHANTLLENAGPGFDLDAARHEVDEFAKLSPKGEKEVRVRMLRSSLTKQEGVGKPLDLEFTDAIKGSEVSIKGLKGKVVVLDFWATWCGPCVAEMPKMKTLYSEYKDKGVEFIGVSLDQPKEKGGLDKLKKFVAENDITWPQYYQGNYWQSEFSSSKGIMSIPCVFVIDADGKLYSVKGRGHLETMIPKLLKQGASTRGTAGGGGR